MGRCDFVSICAIIRRYLLEDVSDSYVQKEQATFDSGRLNRA